MPLRNQLRITDPENRLKIYDLEEIKRVTSLGQDATNDILLKGPGMAAV